MQAFETKKVTISKESFDWLLDKYKAVDSKSHQEYIKFLDDSCTVQFGNGPKVEGKVSMMQVIDQFWDSIHGLKHHFVNVLGADEQIVGEAIIEYTRLDHKVVTIPCVSIIERNDKGLTVSLRIFIDTTPIYQN